MSERGRKVFESRGVSPVRLDHIEYIKELAERLWDAFDEIQVPPGNSEAGRLVSLAKTELESAVMWANKAVSRENP